jgi:hypothetical protein
MRLAITGSAGLIGSQLMNHLRAQGHTVVPVVRGEAPAGAAHWDPERGVIEAAALEGLDGVIHLAGENIAAGRWTPERKQRIRDSRRLGTELLCTTLAGLKRPPAVLIAASGTGYYGDRGEETLTEDSPPGNGFLAKVCREWEAATEPAAAAQIRTINLRLGMVLSARGGALPQLARPVRLGVGGPVGSGRQYWSWIALSEVLQLIPWLLTEPQASGPINAVAPEAVTCGAFMRTLGQVLRRPAILPVPGLALKALLGEMSEAVLAGAKVVPARLQALGYPFAWPTLVSALRHEFGAGAAR